MAPSGNTAFGRREAAERGNEALVTGDRRAKTLLLFPNNDHSLRRPKKDFDVWSGRPGLPHIKPIMDGMRRWKGRQAKEPGPGKRNKE
jgi:hypothetical protein